MRYFAILLAGMALVTGCLTAERAKLPGEASGSHVFVRNYGKYLFDIVPVWCGNASDEPSCDFVMFRDDVTMDKMNHRFLTECRRAGGGEVADVVCHKEHDVMIELPIWSLNIPIPYVWTTREIQISGNVK